MSLLRDAIAFYQLQFELLWKWKPGRRALIRRGIVNLVVSVIALVFTCWLLPGLDIPSPASIVTIVIVMGLINGLVRPVIIGLLSRVSVIAVAIASLAFQIGVFYVLFRLIPENQEIGILTALIASLVYVSASWILIIVFSVDQDASYFGALVRQLSARRPDVIHTDVPGLVIVQIDGLAHPVLAHQLRAGRVNHLSRWIRSGEMVLDRWTALLPSQTSASQAGILHGNNSFIPAFRWWEKTTGRMMVSNHPEDAAEIVRRASDGEGLLSNDGASIGNLVSGDAVRSYITMATIRDKTQGLGRSRTYFSFFASPSNYIHTMILFIFETLKEYVQAYRARRRGIDPSMHRGWPYPVARAATNVALRDLSTSLVIEEMYRGTPVIYVDYTDYDEIAHHSGPERAETLDALDGVDRTIGTLAKAAVDAPRPFRFVILSDHGQSLGATFLQRYGVTLQDVVAANMGGNVDLQSETARVEEWGPLNAALSEAGQAEGAAGAMTRAAFGSRSTDGVVALGASAEDAGDASADASDALLPELVVGASGNLGLISFPRLKGRVTLETIEATWAHLIPALVKHAGIGLVLVHSSKHGPIAFGAEGVNYLAEERVDGTDPVEKYGKFAREGLIRVAGMEHCPDIAVISLVDPGTDEVAAFEELIGSHGGLGGAQTEPFILHPKEWVVDEELVGAEAVYRQIRRWLESGGIGLGRQS